MNFTKLTRGRALYAEKNRLWIARGMTYYAIDYNGNRVSRIFKVGGFIQRVLSWNRLSRHLLREGIHHIVPLKNGGFFVTTKRKSYTMSPDGAVVNVFTGYIGNKPGHQGVCVTPDGSLFFAEYSVNLDHKNQTRLYRSTNEGITFTPVLTFDRNIRHIHFIKHDPYESCLWLGTGDGDNECFLMRSVDNGDTWETIGSGSQDWRAIGVCFTRNCLIWGTDAGSVPDQNHIVRMNRTTRELEIIDDAEGPCHGCASFANGRVFLSTGVEGGQNERDRYARLKEVKSNIVVDLLKKEKDRLPFIVQYGVMRFPLGTHNTEQVVFTAMGLKKGSEVIIKGVCV